MAKSEIKKSKVTYVLELEPFEATVLWNVLRSIGGSTSCSPRKHCDDMVNALEKVMLPQDMQNMAKHEGGPMNGSISFRDYASKK